MSPTLSEEFHTRAKKEIIIAAIVLFPVIVFLLLNLIENLIDLSGFGMMDLVIRCLIMSIIVVAVGLSGAFFPKGSKPKLILKLTTKILAVAALWIVTFGGTIEADLMESFLSSLMSELDVLDAKLYIGLVVFNVVVSLLILLRCLVPYGEYKDCRQKYLEKHFGNE